MAAVPARADSTITCKSGNFNVYYMNWNTYGRNSVGNYGPALFVYFNKGGSPAKTVLKPGECAFSDRAIRSSEPNNLVFRSPILTSIEFNNSRVLKYSFQDPHWLAKLLSGNGRLYVFQVHEEDQYGATFVIDK